jgi:hypothetical protein
MDNIRKPRPYISANKGNEVPNTVNALRIIIHDLNVIETIL